MSLVTMLARLQGLIILCVHMENCSSFTGIEIVYVTECTKILTLSLLESIMEICSAVLTFESVDEILWCDYSNETTSAVLLHGTTYFSIFYKMKFWI